MATKQVGLSQFRHQGITTQLIATFHSPDTFPFEGKPIYNLSVELNANGDTVMLRTIADHFILSETNGSTSDFLQKVRGIEGKIGQVSHQPLMYHAEWWSVDIQEDALRTNLRAPSYFLPDGLSFGGEQFYEATVVSEQGAQSRLILPGREIAIMPPQHVLHVQHKGALKALREETAGHYANNFIAEDFLETAASSLSHVEYWDVRAGGLMESAARVASAIQARVPGSEVILYGSLARGDKMPGDLDLMVLHDSDGFDPLKYYEKKTPERYNVETITLGLATEMGIIEDLAHIGRKPADWREEDYRFYGPTDFEYSPNGGGININALSRRFFSDAPFRESLMRAAFTPQYFKNALTDGRIFDGAAFTEPAAQKYAGMIETLAGELVAAKAAGWPNAGNMPPQKLFYR